MTNVVLTRYVRVVSRCRPRTLFVPHGLYYKTKGRTYCTHHIIFPHDMDMLAILSTENSTNAAKMLAEALLNPAPALPFISSGND